MAQFASQPDRDIREVSRNEVVEAEDNRIANPIPLGLGALAFTTAVLGCSYAGFIVPSLRTGLSVVVAAALFYGGIVQILAGMWEFRRDNTIAATIFSSYGGFLVAFGVLFLPSFGLTSSLSVNGLHAALGLLFLCWTIFTGVLFLGSFRTSIAMLLVLALLFLSFLFLTIGQLASANTVLLAIGGWIAIATAIVAWYTAWAGMLNTTNSPYKLPLGMMR
jgi:hypothetical protein